MRIARPTGELPPEGEPGVASASEALLVFDTPAAPGKCVARCEATELAALSPADRELVWGMLKWKLPTVGGVDPGDGDGEEDGRVAIFTYEGMPSHNDAFGNTHVVLSFEARPQWAYYQPVQFRYQRTGTRAAAAVLAANTLSANHVAVGNPNWYVYWQQVANQEGFGPQTKMNFASNGGGLGQYNHSVTIYQNGEIAWADQITIFAAAGDDISLCISTIHHENGHRQSYQFPDTKGGWGLGLNYDLGQDEDRDFVHDLWEHEGDENHVPPIPRGGGYSEGFRRNVDDESRRTAWEHGWGPEDGPPWNSVINPDGDEEETGRGLCVSNEKLVEAQSESIKLRDWSHEEPNHE